MTLSLCSMTSTGSNMLESLSILRLKCCLSLATLINWLQRSSSSSFRWRTTTKCENRTCLLSILDRRVIIYPFSPLLQGRGECARSTKSSYQCCNYDGHQYADRYPNGLDRLVVVVAVPTDFRLQNVGRHTVILHVTVCDCASVCASIYTRVRIIPEYPLLWMEEVYVSEHFNVELLMVHVSRMRVVFILFDNTFL